MNHLFDVRIFLIDKVIKNFVITMDFNDTKGFHHYRYFSMILKMIIKI